MSKLMIKDLLLGKAFFAVNKRAIKQYGLVEASVLSLLCDYETTSKELTFDGWFPVTAEAVQDALNIGRKPYDSAIANLKNMQLISTSVRGVPARKFFRLEYSVIQTSLFNMDSQDCSESTDLFVQKEQTSLSKTDKQDCPKGTGLNNIGNKEVIIEEDNNKEPIKKEVKKKVLDESFVDPAFKDAWELWLKYKRQIGKSYSTPLSLQAAYEKLVFELSGNDPQVAMLIVKQSVENNWLGLFPLKNNATTSTTKSSAAADARSAYRGLEDECDRLLNAGC